MGWTDPSFTYREEAAYLVNNPNYAHDRRRSDQNKSYRILAFIVYIIAVFYLFPSLFTAKAFSLFVFNMLALIVIFIIGLRTYGFILNKVRYERMKKEYSNTTKEYTDYDIIHSPEYTSTIEWKKICFHCGTKIFAEKAFCPSCGAELNSDKIRHGKLEQTTVSSKDSDISRVHLPESVSKNDWKVCFHCGAKILVTDVFCPNCGREKP